MTEAPSDFHDEGCAEGESGSDSETIRTEYFDRPVRLYRRRYHLYNEGKYPFPDDEEEQERLDLQHNIFNITFDNKLSLILI